MAIDVVSYNLHLIICIYTVSIYKNKATDDELLPPLIPSWYFLWCMRCLIPAASHSWSQAAMARLASKGATALRSGEEQAQWPYAAAEEKAPYAAAEQPALARPHGMMMCDATAP